MENKRPFDILGHNHGVFYYLSHGSGQVVALKVEKHTPKYLYQLAPHHWWEDNFRTKQGVNWMAALNSLIQKSYSTGIYDPGRIGPKA